MQDTMILYMFNMKINTNMTPIIVFLGYQIQQRLFLFRRETKEGLSLIDKIFQFYTATKIHILKREKEKMVEAWKRHSKTYVIRYDQINLAHSDI